MKIIKTEDLKTSPGHQKNTQGTQNMAQTSLLLINFFLKNYFNSLELFHLPIDSIKSYIIKD